jgi:hypothetical protein
VERLIPKKLMQKRFRKIDEKNRTKQKMQLSFDKGSAGKALSDRVYYLKYRDLKS